MLPFSCLLASACDKYRKITPGTVQKNCGISLSILPGLSIFSCHFLRSKYIYTQSTFSWIFCCGSHWCESSLGHPCSLWMLSQCVVPEHPAWHRAAQTSEKSLSVWRQAPQQQSWGRMFTSDFWCLQSKVMTCNSKSPAREWWWFIVFMMSGKILFYIAADLSDKHCLILKEQVITVTSNLPNPRRKKIWLKNKNKKRHELFSIILMQRMKLRQK